MNYKRHKHPLVVANGKLYAIGGYQEKRFTKFCKSVEEYDPATNRWRKLIMTEQSSSSNPTYDDDFSMNPVDPNPPLPDFITRLNVQQQTLIKSIWNSDTQTLSEKIACIGALCDKMAEGTRREYSRWRFQHDKSSVNAFLEKQNPTMQNRIRLCLSSQSNLDEFYNSMLVLLPSFDDKEAFLNWAKTEMLQCSSALMNDTNLIQNSPKNIPTNTVDGAHNKILFYLLYDEDTSPEGRNCFFNSNTFEVEIVEKFSTWTFPYKVAAGNDKIFLIDGDKKVFEIFNYETKQLTKGLDPPEWRDFAAVAYYKNKLYYIGGRDSNNDLSSCVNILVNEKWQRGPDFPVNVEFAMHAICNDKLYIICANAVFQLSNSEREWIEVGKIEETRYSPTVASLNGKIYITGGWDCGALNSCLCFDPSQPFNKRFIPIANMHFNRYHHSLVVVNGKLYAIGGYQEDDEFCKSVEEYDPATDSWRISNNALLNIESLSMDNTKPSDIPSHNDNETIVATPNYHQNDKTLFYLAYGEDPNDEGRICLFNSITFEVEIVEKFSTCVNPCSVARGKDQMFLINGYNKVFEIFNYETKQLTKGPDPPEWRDDATVAYYKNKLYYIGGWDSNGSWSSCVNTLVNGEWQRGPVFSISVESARHVICNDKLYIISCDAVFQLSDNEREWFEIGKMEEKRWNPAVASLNGKIYIIGGKYNSETLNSCLCFDPNKPFDRRFTSIENMNYERYCHSLLVANEKLYAIGGYHEVFDIILISSSFPLSPRKFWKSIEEYDPATDSWRISNNSPFNLTNLTINDTKPSDIPSHNENETIVAMPNYPQNDKTLFYLTYGENPNFEGRICLFDPITFEVEIIEKFSTCSWSNEVAIGNNQIFLIDGDKKVFEIFNYETKQLTKGPDPPEWRDDATVTHYKNKLYYIGGKVSNDRLSNGVNILLNGKWKRGPDFPISVWSARHEICNDKLYIISYNAVLQLSDDEREWIEVGKMQGMRWYHAVASFNGRIYITGGYNGKILNSCLCFDPSKPFDRRFTTIANMHSNRRYHSLVVANGKLYAIGGYQEDGASKFCKSAEEYDPATNRWRIVEEIGSSYNYFLSFYNEFWNSS